MAPGGAGRRCGARGWEPAPPRDRCRPPQPLPLGSILKLTEPGPVTKWSNLHYTTRRELETPTEQLRITCLAFQPSY
ncbi:hypothetical protein Y1Q_0011471 [Alligator mississippiensis]|uniref:Uncharacterized protein n=1 Tax=Alligator mississippiensis TaxID=8496 RepID=A0A151LZU2_ALLMI|nr:hypothetical protein Y1Q_0011471 [Alligator mississippiensis]